MSVTVKQKNKGWLEALIKRRKSGKVVAVGFPADKVGGLKYPDGKDGEDGQSVLKVAGYNNFGTEHIPRRDFMTPGGANAIEKTKDIRKKIVQKVDKGSATIDSSIEEMGSVAVAQIQNAIRDLKDPPNDPKTIKQKQSSNPLIDTPLMILSVTYEVRDK